MPSSALCHSVSAVAPFSPCEPPPLDECQKFHRFSWSGYLAIYRDSPSYIGYPLNKTLPQPVHVDGHYLSIPRSLCRPLGGGLRSTCLSIRREHQWDSAHVTLLPVLLTECAPLELTLLTRSPVPHLTLYTPNLHGAQIAHYKLLLVSSSPRKLTTTPLCPRCSPPWRKPAADLLSQPLSCFAVHLLTQQELH